MALQYKWCNQVNTQKSVETRKPFGG